MRHMSVVLGSALAAAVVGLCGCGTGEDGSASAAEEPAAVRVVPGSDVSRITLSVRAERRLGIKTRRVTAGSGTQPGLVIPYAAVVYDPDGKAYAFTRAADRTYVRAPLAIKSIDGNQVRLVSGPPAGTPVVTVGAAELVGAEAGISGEE
jgi:hypothetical protein